MVGRLLEYLKSAANTVSRVVLLDFSVLLTRGTSLQSLAEPRSGPAALPVTVLFVRNRQDTSACFLKRMVLKLKPCVIFK